MIISTQTDVTAKRFGLNKSIELIAEAGFDAVDVSMFEGQTNEWLYNDGFEAKIEEAKKIAENSGVFFNQAHAPFPSFRVGDDEYNERIRPRLIRAIEIAGMLSVKNIVIHPVYFERFKKEKNLEMYNELLPFAKSAGVKIAIENMWGRDKRRNVIIPNVCSVASELADYYDSLDSTWFTVCLDLGHIGLVGEYEYDFIKALGGERLTCLHIHDNDYIHDSHTAPFTMNLPWNDICKGLAEINYRGDLTLEADNFIAGMPDELIPAGLKFMNEAAKCLDGKINSYIK